MSSKTEHLTDKTQDLYPSRTGGNATLLPRKDAVVYGDPSDGPLTKAQLDEYDDNGFHLREAFLESSRLEACRDELLRLRDELRGSDDDDVITEPGGHEVRSIFAIHRKGGILEELCRDEELVATARQILGGDVYIHQSRINYKPGFRGREFFWHSDFETWHVEDGLPRMRTLSMSITLTDNNAHNGPLLLIPGSQRIFVSCPGKTPEEHFRSSLAKQEHGVPDDDNLARLVDESGIAAATGPAGSIAMFDCNTMHASNGNVTPWPRSNVFVVFNSVENPPVAPFSGQPPRPWFLAEREDFTPLA